MRYLSFGLLSVAFAACAAPQYAERLPAQSAPAMPLANAAPLGGSVRPVRAAPMNEAATSAWLDQQIDQNRYVPPPPPPPPPVERVEVERVVEQPVYVQERVVYADGYYQPYYYGGYYGRPYEYRSHRSTTFPLHTALGAGLGAVIGHQSGHRGRGAWIGGGLGLLFDLNSRW